MIDPVSFTQGFLTFFFLSIAFAIWVKMNDKF